MRLSGRKVLVTGSTGFIGSRLVEKLLLEEGASVNCLVRNWEKAVWVSRTAADLYPGDVTNVDMLNRAIAGCSVVMHCASGGTTRAELFRTNVEGTANLLEAAAKQRVERFVYVSSIAVHGSSPAPGTSAQSEYNDCGRAYSASKIAAEKVVLEYAARGSMQCVIIRPTFVWGPRSQLFTQGPLKAMRAGRFRWVDEGRGTCHAVHVDNLIESLLLAVTRDHLNGKAFLVTDEAGLTWREFFTPLLQLLEIPDAPSINSRSWRTQLMCRLKDASGAIVARLSGDGKSLPVRVVRRLFREVDVRLGQRGTLSLWDLQKYARSGTLDTDSTREELGYRPVLTFPEALEQTIAWIRLQLADELGLATDRGLGLLARSQAKT